MVGRDAADTLAVDRQFHAQEQVGREGHRRDAEAKGHARPHVQQVAIDVENLVVHARHYSERRRGRRMDGAAVCASAVTNARVNIRNLRRRFIFMLRGAMVQSRFCDSPFVNGVWLFQGRSVP